MNIYTSSLLLVHQPCVRMRRRADSAPFGNSAREALASPCHQLLVTKTQNKNTQNKNNSSPCLFNLRFAGGNAREGCVGRRLRRRGGGRPAAVAVPCWFCARPPLHVTRLGALQLLRSNHQADDVARRHAEPRSLKAVGGARRRRVATMA